VNEFYSAPSTPIDFSTAKSKPIRDQWAAIEAAFDKLDGRITFVDFGGTANALTATLPSPPEAYAEGFEINGKIATTNTGPATLNVNGLGAKAIVGRDGSALIAGDLVAGSVETMFYVDGRFMIRAVAGAQGPQGPMGSVEEAPIDGGIYSRQDGAWVATPAGPEGPEGPQGIQGPQGDPGADGADGNTILYGVGAPAAGLGVDGDFYIATNTNFIYGPKAGGAWPAGTSIVGPQGPAGPAGADGAGSTWGALGGRPADLVSLGALSPAAANKLPYLSGIDTFSLTDITAFGRSLLAANDLSALGALDVLTISSVSLTMPGWLRLNTSAGVFTIMWGSNVIAANGMTVINYPDGGFGTFSCAVISGPAKTGNDAQDNGPSVLSCAKDKFTVHNASDVAQTAFWHAVGK
jgi:hypothetical protein